MIKVVLLTVLVILFSASVNAGASDTSFCRSPQGYHCNTYNSQLEAIEVATLQQDEEGEPTVLHMGNGGWYQSININRPYDCVSSCDWIRADKYVCDDCVYPFAFYNKTVGYKNQQCITEDNKWSVMKDEPHKVETYVETCKSKGVCNCRRPPPRCTISCESFYNAVCPLQESSSTNNNGLLKFVKLFSSKKNKKQENIKFLKCDTFTASKKSKTSSRVNQIFKFKTAASRANLVVNKELAKLGIKPFDFTEEAGNVRLNFDIKELNYWCPYSADSVSSSSSSSSKSRLSRSIFGSAASSIRKMKGGAQFAPKKILEAIDSYCSFKIDKAEAQFNEKLKVAKEKYAKNEAEKAAKKAANQAAKALKGKNIKDKYRNRIIENAAKHAAANAERNARYKFGRIKPKPEPKKPKLDGVIQNAIQQGKIANQPAVTAAPALKKL